MAKKASPEKPALSSLLPGFQHLIPSAAAAPLAAHIRPLFLPDLVQQIARNKQIDANRREQAHPAFRKWAKDLKQGVLQQLHETQVEQDFNHVLLRVGLHDPVRRCVGPALDADPEVERPRLGRGRRGAGEVSARRVRSVVRRAAGHGRAEGGEG